MSKTIKTYGALLGFALAISAVPAFAADVEYSYPMGKGHFSKPTTASGDVQAHPKALPVSEYPTGKAGQRQGPVWEKHVGGKASYVKKTVSDYPTGKAGQR